MASFTPEVDALIRRYGLGTRYRVARPNIRGTVGRAVFVMALCVAWLIAGTVFVVSGARHMPVWFECLQIAAPVGAIIAWLRVIAKALAVWHCRLVVCEHGVALVTPDSRGAFRWEQLQAISRREFVTHHEKNRQEWTSHRFVYTILLHDGRTFILDDSGPFGGAVNDVARLIDKRLNPSQEGRW